MLMSSVFVWSGSASLSDTMVLRSRSETKLCADSAVQLCKQMCQPFVCPAGRCAKRTGTCCEYRCQAQDEVEDLRTEVVEPKEESTELVERTEEGANVMEREEETSLVCEESPKKICLMFCPPLACPKGSCAQRIGSCCDFQCKPTGAIDNSLVPVPPKTELLEGVVTAICEASPKQLCREQCPTVRCPRGSCAKRLGNCCDFKCQGGL